MIEFLKSLLYKEWNDNLTLATAYVQVWLPLAFIILGAWMIALGCFAWSTRAEVVHMFYVKFAKKGDPDLPSKNGIWWLLGGIFWLLLGLLMLFWGRPAEEAKLLTDKNNELIAARNELEKAKEDLQSIKTAKLEVTAKFDEQKKIADAKEVSLSRAMDDNRRLIGAGHLPANISLSPELEALFRAASETGRKVIHYPFPAMLLYRTDISPGVFETEANRLLGLSEKETFVLETITLSCTDGKSLESAIVTGKVGMETRRLRIALNWKEPQVKEFADAHATFFLASRQEEWLRRAPQPVPPQTLPSLLTPLRESGDPAPLPVPVPPSGRNN